MNRHALALLVTVVAISGCGDTPAPAPSADALPTAVDPAPPTDPAVKRQDRFTDDEREMHERAMTERPLLNHLPLTIRGVTIDIGGLTDEDRPLITLTAPGRSESYARAAYETALEQFDDTGKAYVVEVAR